MKHLGDITGLDGYSIPPVDVVTGGSPCQDLSIAGKREGLAGARSGLYMEQIRVIKELRQADVLRGRTGQLIRPRFMVWENVPGAFTSNKGKDFAAVLEEAIRIAEPKAPPISVPNGGWDTSGCYFDVDGRWSVAWRVFNAQFWGVPQRRRRIALVADFGGLAAPEILFVRRSVCWDSETVRDTRETVAPGIGERSVGAVTLRMRAGCAGGGKWPLIQEEKSGTLLTGSNDQTLFQLSAGFKYHNGPKAHGIGYEEECSTCLDTWKPPAVYENHGQDSRITGPLSVAPTISQKFGTGGNNTPLVMATGQAKAEILEDASPTLSCNHEQPIVFDKEVYNSGVNAKGGHYISKGGPAPAMRATGHPPGVLQIAGVDCRNFAEHSELYPTLQAKSNGGQSLNYSGAVRTNTIVRRLTPP